MRVNCLLEISGRLIAFVGLAACGGGGEGGGFPAGVLLGPGTTTNSAMDATADSAGDEGNTYSAGGSSGVGTAGEDGSSGGSTTPSPGTCDPTSCTGCCS